MTRWFFPLGIAFILVAVALSHWEHAPPQPAALPAPASQSTPAVEAGAAPRAVFGY